MPLKWEAKLLPNTPFFTLIKDVCSTYIKGSHACQLKTQNFKLATKNWRKNQYISPDKEINMMKK